MLARGLAVRDVNGSPYRMVGSTTAITERKQAEQLLLHDALHDGLTGLPNRRLLLERMEHVLTVTRRHGDYRAAVLFLDLDRFKVINDSLGHPVGDTLLRLVAKRLLKCVRAGDTVARLGGDEFGLLLEPIGEWDDTNTVIRRIHSELAQPFYVEGCEIHTSASIGVTRESASYESADELLRDADTAMYQAKREGGARHVLFQAGMRAGVMRRFSLEAHLRRAVERNELLLHYQPIVGIEDERTRGFEALARWEHPERGTIPPIDFIPIAEETGLIVPIGRWVLLQACQQMRRWQRDLPEAPPGYVSINVSPRQLAHLGFWDDVTAVLAETGLDPRSLRLEITENAIMENAGRAAKLLPRFREAGIGLYMDDFGTGYSSLSYLHNFPFDALKIDRSFIHNMAGDARHRELVATILSLAESFGMQAIAEGVESAEQLEMLRKMGCRYAQGFYFSAPLAAEDVTGRPGGERGEVRTGSPDDRMEVA